MPLPTGIAKHHRAPRPNGQQHPRVYAELDLERDDPKPPRLAAFAIRLTLWWANRKLKRTHNPTIMKMLINWKSSVSGLAAIATGLGGIFHAVADGFQGADIDVITAAAGAIAAGVGLLFTRDSDKTSEEVGAK